MKPAALLLSVLFVPLVQGQVTVKRIQGEIPHDPSHAAWASAPAAPVLLMRQILALPQGGGAVASAELRALHNGRRIAFSLAWSDSAAEPAREIASFQDMAALMFPSAGKDPGGVSPFMGDPENPAAIWLWRADFAADLDGSGRARLDSEYPAYADFYNANHETTVFRYRSHAGAGRVPSSVEALVARGFGTVSPDTAEAVQGSSTFENGRRNVVFLRDMAPAGGLGAQFRRGTATGINVAIWDGGSGERGARKSVGMSWIPVVVE